LKAFSRKKSFSASAAAISPNGMEDIHQDLVEGSTGYVKAETMPFSTGSPFRSDRLVRRAAALQDLLESEGSMEAVTPLGMHVFGLDVIDTR
jgi:hypothetical protein